MALLHNLKQFFLRLWRGKQTSLNNINRPNKRKATPFYRNKHGYPKSIKFCKRDDDYGT